MSEDARVAHCRDRLRDIDGPCLILLIGEDPQTVRDSCDEIRNVDDRPCHWNAPGLGAREQQEILDEPSEPIDFLEHTGDDLTILVNGQGSLERHLAHASDPGERRPQLVRRVRREAAQLFECGVEPRQCLVEHAGEASEFVARIVDGQPSAQ